MVTRLADALCEECDNHAVVVDPFCGSGGVLLAAQRRRIGFAGVDINPYAVLLARVQTECVQRSAAKRLFEDFAERVAGCDASEPLPLQNETYWFTPATLLKLCRMRYVAQEMNLFRSCSGRAVLLAAAQSVRLVSRADNRSPKPFISKAAVAQKSGRHRDPMKYTELMLDNICDFYETVRGPASVGTSIRWADARTIKIWNDLASVRRFSHLITSPPYICAQDYFRNFKFEIAFLESTMPFVANGLSGRFVGRERGLRSTALEEVGEEAVRRIDGLDAQLARFRCTFPKTGAVVYRYFQDMETVFTNACERLTGDAEVRMVCADNVLCRVSLATGDLLCRILSDLGFDLIDAKVDSIKARAVPPSRAWHTGVMESETIYRLKRRSR